MTVKHRIILYLAGILVLCLAFTIALADESTPSDPPVVETPTPTEPVITEEAPAPQQGQIDLPPNPPLLAPEAEVTELPTEEIQPIEPMDPPFFPEMAPTTEEGLQPGQASAPATIEAVVVRSYGGCPSTSTFWDSLNTSWSNYGSIPIHINYNYPGLCNGPITYTALVASKADVVIISDPSGIPYQYSSEEISAIQQYAAEGHHLVGTYLLFQYGLYDNRGLAPLFGLQGGLTYIVTPATITPTYNYLESANPLFKKLSLTYASAGYNYSQVPSSGTWSAAALNGARITAISADQKSAIISYHAPNYHATYISNMPEYGGGTADKQFLYNAITYDVIDAVVVKSYNNCTSNSLIWDNLNNSWPSYGAVPIHVRYKTPGLCSGTITYDALVASKADVIILSDPSGAPYQYTAAEISALQQYANEGHNLIGSYLLLQWETYDNRLLAPLFGLQSGITYNVTPVTPAYTFRESGNPLFKHLTAPYASSGYAFSQVPSSGTWSAAALNGARIVASTTDQKAAILAYDAAKYRAIYITNMPEYNGGTADKLFIYNAIRYATDAVVVRSWGGCSSSSLVWDSLNQTSMNYGSYPVNILYSYHGLCDGTISYPALAASKADVVIISDPVGGGQSYSAPEISALQQYANEGHHLLGTYLLLQSGSIDNRGLATLFGLQSGLTYIVTPATITPTYNYLEPANPLFKKLGLTYASLGYNYSQVPGSGTWSAAALNGARIAAINADQKSAIFSYHAPNYHATYISNMPEYGGGTADKQFIYNAITYHVTEAVVVRSYSGCTSSSVIWNSLNATWPSYGSVPIHIRYATPGLCDGPITYANLAASGAEVVILSDPAGANLQYSAAEISALQQYAQEGHHLIGTYALLQWNTYDNRLLAPLFGILSSTSWNYDTTNRTFNLYEPRHPLFWKLSSPYVSSGLNQTAYPAGGAWSNGARIVAVTSDGRAAILVYEPATYHAVWVTSMPEYNGGDSDKQFFYNAILYLRRVFLPLTLK